MTARAKPQSYRAKLSGAIAYIRVEVRFAEQDEREGAATEGTRRVRFEWINKAIDLAEKASRARQRKAAP